MHVAWRWELAGIRLPVPTYGFVQAGVIVSDRFCI
jgi:hypothetical protein